MEEATTSASSGVVTGAVVTKTPFDRPGPAPTTMVVASSEAEAAPLVPGALVPFRQLDRDLMARIVLLQKDTTNFALIEGFRYAGAAGSWTVQPADLQNTDLASVPRFLGWFASRYGRHTLAALLHDYLVRNGQRLDPKVTRAEADDVFRVALDELDVAFVRARIMWSAVTLATRWQESWAARLGIGLWMVAAVAGIVGLVMGAVMLDPVLFGLAALAPLPFALLWSRRQCWAGVYAGYTLWLIALPALVNLAAYGIYALTERVVRWARKLRPVNRSKDLPDPPRYEAL
jgi:hypothetical protein